MRGPYAGQVYARLPAGCRGLLFTLEYPQTEMNGPPFSVPEAEVRALHGEWWDIDVLDRRDVLAKEPHFAERGVSRMDTVAYLMTRKA
jgi:thiopurine S-methyltransferase